MTYSVPKLLNLAFYSDHMSENSKSFQKIHRLGNDVLSEVQNLYFKSIKQIFKSCPGTMRLWGPQEAFTGKNLREISIILQNGLRLAKEEEDFEKKENELQENESALDRISEETGLKTLFIPNNSCMFRIEEPISQQA